MKTVYVGMSADRIHHGHINIINIAKKYGRVTVGILTDESISTYKRPPKLQFDERKIIIGALKGVYRVVPQYMLDYTENLKKYKPDFVVHGDDWKEGVQKETRQKVIDVLKEWDGKLIEPEYTKGISSTEITDDELSCGITPGERRGKLKRLLELKLLIRVFGAHNGLSAIVAERTRVTKGKETREFDAIWESSLCSSSARGKPDIELVDWTSRIQTINEMLEVTTKPIIVDGDTGGMPEHFKYLVKTLERLGVSAIIIEDKCFPKKNSLLNNAVHKMEDPMVFGRKIQAGVHARVTTDFLIIGRIESLISGETVKEAIQRAKMYIEYGADAIMIHSKQKKPAEILKFCKEYKKLDKRVPLVAVPTTYNVIDEEELMNAGVNVVIYANHMIRAGLKSMKEAARTILYDGRSNMVDCSPVTELFDIVEGK